MVNYKNFRVYLETIFKSSFMFFIIKNTENTFESNQNCFLFFVFNNIKYDVFVFKSNYTNI